NAFAEGWSESGVRWERLGAFPMSRSARFTNSMEDFLQRRKKMSKQMTPADIELIQQSFARLVPISDKAAALFYDRLFEVAPEVKPLFRGDMTGQGRKLMAALAVRAENQILQYW